MLQMFDVLALLRMGGILVPPRTNMTIPHFFVAHSSVYVRKSKKEQNPGSVEAAFIRAHASATSARENAKSEN